MIARAKENAPADIKALIEKREQGERLAPAERMQLRGYIHQRVEAWRERHKP
ncbi:MAG TPA: hypothetical protein VM141_02265 [Planctomycetota bacterium]|nr:hypothetical protein [Planctomycetota bacterium]